MMKKIQEIYESKDPHWRSFPKIRKQDAVKLGVPKDCIVSTSDGYVYRPAKGGGYSNTYKTIWDIDNTE